MPSYELSVIFKILERPELIQVIRRTTEAIIERGGVIKALENVGVRRTPYNIFSHGTKLVEGNYYLMRFDGPPEMISDLKAHLRLDTDVFKPMILRAEEEVSRPCQHRDCDFGEMTIESRKRLKEDLENFVKKL